MEEKSIFERFQIQAEEIFKQATFGEFFGNYLFETSERSYYMFAPDELGDAVWLNPKLEAMHIEEARKLPQQQVIPAPCSFNHCVPIDFTLFEDKRFEDIKTKLRQGGKSLGQKVNKAFIDVLNASIADENTMRAESPNLDSLLADVFSRQAKAGFPPDKFIFPEHLGAKLVQLGIIIRDKEIPNLHYIGQTKFGQVAFWSEILQSGTILMFDSKIGLALMKEPRYFVGMIGPFTPGVCGYLELNPIVKNRLGVIAITNVDRALTRSTGGITGMQTQPRDKGDIVMGDKYEIGQAGAVGPGSYAHDMTFNQIWNKVEGTIDLPRLSEELAILRQEMKKEATEPEHDIAIGAIAAAEQAAKTGNGPKTLESLKPAGKWALSVAEKIGVGVAIAALKSGLGI